MKRLLLAGAAFLGLTALGSGARAALFDFTYSGSLVDFPVPTTDASQILAFGAQGGSGQCHFCIPAVSGPGGLGAEIGGDFVLDAGGFCRSPSAARVATLSAAAGAAVLSLDQATRRWS